MRCSPGRCNVSNRIGVTTLMLWQEESFRFVELQAAFQTEVWRSQRLWQRWQWSPRTAYQWSAATTHLVGVRIATGTAGADRQRRPAVW